MKKYPTLIILQTILFSAFVSLDIYAQVVKHAEPITYEEGIRANIEVGSLHLNLKAHQAPQIYQYYSPANQPLKLQSSYKIRGNKGHLNVHTHQQRKASRQKMVGWELFGNPSKKESSIAPLNLSLTDSLPLDLKISVGSSASEFDLTDLKLRNLHMNIGACNARVFFSRKNPEKMRHMHVSTGASQVVLAGLGYANFDRFSFNGGVTDVTIDFDGEIEQEAKINITIDAGSMKIIIPKNVGVKLHQDRHFFSNVTIPEDFNKSDGYYYSNNYGKTPGTLLMYLKSGAGSVDISWK